MQSATRTIMYKLKCEDNHALHELMMERKEKFDEKGQDKFVRAVLQAAKSVRSHPMLIRTKGQFAELKYVGAFIVNQFASFFDENPPPQEAGTGGQGPSPEEGPPPAKKRKTAPYVPKLNSAPYALLITMYRALAEGKTEYRRDELIRDAEKSGLSEKPIGMNGLNGEANRRTTHGVQDYYTVWSSMSKQLIAKGLVLKLGNPPTYNLTPEGEETARLCLQRSNMADPLPQQDPAAGAAHPPPAPNVPTAPSVAPKNPRSAAAAAAEARMAKKPTGGGAGPSSVFGGSAELQEAARKYPSSAGRAMYHTVYPVDAQLEGGAAAAGGAGGFKGLVEERPDLARMGTSGGVGEGRAEEGGNGSDLEELDSWPAGTPETSTQPTIEEETVQKLVSLGFSPVQARRALQATHVDGVPESPWVEQAANWLLENDLDAPPPKPKSPVRPSFGARLASEQREPSRAGRFDHLFEDEADPGGTTGVQNQRPGGVQSAARVPGRPPAVPVHRPPTATRAGPSGAGPSGTARARTEGSPSTPLKGAVPLDVRTPPLLDNERFGDRYDVVCLIDQREYMVRKAGTSAPVVAEFEGKGLKCEVRSLELGDFLWIAKERGGSSEYVLDYVCERKRVDDLVLSIQSSRYQRQKHFLDTCGLRRRIFLLEDDPDRMDDQQKIKTALVSTELVNGFDVQRTTNSQDTIRRLVTLTAAIREKLQDRRGGQADQEEDRLLTYGEFDKRAKASRRRTVKDLWGLMLTQVGSIGSDSANVIMQKFPTAVALYEAYRNLDKEDKADVLSKQLVAKFVRNAGGMNVGTKASENLYKFMYGQTLPDDDDKQP